MKLTFDTAIRPHLKPDIILSVATSNNRLKTLCSGYLITGNLINKFYRNSQMNMFVNF